MERQYRRLKVSLSAHLNEDTIGIVLSYFDVELYHRYQWTPRNPSGKDFISRGICHLPDKRILVLDEDRGYTFTQRGELLGRWGTAKFFLPSCVAPTSRGEIAVVDINHRVIIFTPEGRYLRQWGRYGQEAGEFNRPMGICCVSSPGREDEIVVADTHNHRIQFFTLDGKFIRQCGKQGSGKREFSYPQGIATFRGEIIVADTCNSRIQILSRKGKFLRQWGRPQHCGGFNQPTKVALLTLPGRECRVVVVDTLEFRVQIFTLREGRFLSQWKWDELLPPGSITTSPSGEIAVVVSGGEQIQIVGVHLC